MKKHALLLFLLLRLTTARADIVMVNETAIGEVKSKTVLSIRGDMVRTDNGTETSVIMDTAKGEMTTLMHEQKMVVKTDLNALKAASAALGDKAVPGADLKPTITSTGKKEKINGYDCEIYTVELKGMSSRLWIAKDYPGYEKLKKELSVMEKLGTPGQKQPPMPGLALKTEYEQQGFKFTTMLVSLKEQPVDETIFKVPAGYKAPGE